MPYADTLQIYDVLRKEFDEGKAKAIAASIETALESNNGILLERIATKEDIANLRAEMIAQIAGLETKTAAQIGGLKNETIHQIAGLETKIAAQIASLKVEMAAQKAEIIRMNFLFWLGLIPVMAALIKFIR